MRQFPRLCFNVEPIPAHHMQGTSWKYFPTPLGIESFLRSWLFLSYSRDSLHFMEPEGSLPHTQEPAIFPFPETDQSRPFPTPTSWISILMLSFHLCLGFPSDFSPQVSPPKPCMHLCPPYSYMPHPSQSCFHHPNTSNIWWAVQIIKLLVI